MSVRRASRLKLWVFTTTCWKYSVNCPEQWDFQNKGKSRWTGTSCIVLKVPLRNLLTSMWDFVPCVWIVQRAYWKPLSCKTNYVLKLKVKTSLLSCNIKGTFQLLHFIVLFRLRVPSCFLVFSHSFHFHFHLLLHCLFLFLPVFLFPYSLVLYCRLLYCLCCGRKGKQLFWKPFKSRISKHNRN